MPEKITKTHIATFLTLQVIKEENSILQVDLSKPPDSDIMDDSPASVRDALVFLELANLESPNSLPKPRGNTFFLEFIIT